MQELTKAEEQIMHILWKQGPSFVKDMVDEFTGPKPAITTVSTIVRILEQKGFVDHEAFGRSHRYRPLITRDEYARFTLGALVDNFFAGSPENLVSFFVREKKLSIKDLDEILATIEKGKKEKR